MIQLTRLNHQLLVVNSDLIKFIERSPDTTLTLTSGEKLVVRESLDEVISRVVEFRHAITPRAQASWLDTTPGGKKG